MAEIQDATEFLAKARREQLDRHVLATSGVAVARFEHIPGSHFCSDLYHHHTEPDGTVVHYYMSDSLHEMVRLNQAMPHHFSPRCSPFSFSFLPIPLSLLPCCSLAIWLVWLHASFDVATSFVFTCSNPPMNLLLCVPFRLWSSFRPLPIHPSVSTTSAPWAFLHHLFCCLPEGLLPWRFTPRPRLPMCGLRSTTTRPCGRNGPSTRVPALGGSGYGR